jgi:hypothetical protein
MLSLRSRICSLALGAILVSSSTVFAQAVPGQQPGVEVLARGAVHEAYASTAEFPTPGAPVGKVPPQPIEELPPDQRPTGDNVQWIPGYWSWDEERNDFIWISGFWRAAPPGRVWVPGSWREGRGGWQWASGFWQTAQQPTQNLEYLPQPPQPLEVAPQVPAPQPMSYYVPGCWVFRDRYVWRPGFWIDHRPGWIWVPASYRWSPAGYVFVEGYWDLPLHERGVLFAPVAFQPGVIVRPQFVYTPTYVVAQPALVSSLFIRRGHGHYYFGDYFEQRYVSIGFNAWCGNVRGTSFALSVGFGRANTYDPNWAYYQLHHRSDPVWATNVGDIYAARFRGDAPRPPRTLVQQNTVVNNITNVTNTNIVNNNVTNIINNNTTNNNTTNNITRNNQALTMVTPLKTVNNFNPAVTLQSVKQEERTREVQLVKQMNDVGTQRTKMESSLVNRQMVPQTATDKPRQMKLELPQQVVTRAQAPVQSSKAPPPPPQQAEMRRPEVKAVVAPTSVKPEVKSVVPPMPVSKPTTQPMPVKPVVPQVPVKPEVKPVVPQVPVKPEVKPVVPPAPVSKPTTQPMPVKPEVKSVVPQVPVKPEVKSVVPPAPTTQPMPVKPEVKPVVPQVPVSKPVVPPAPVSKPVTPPAPVGKPVTPPAPVGKPVTPPAPVGKPVTPTTKPTEKKPEPGKG